jgi:hypothetical protein
MYLLLISRGKFTIYSSISEFPLCFSLQFHFNRSALCHDYPNWTGPVKLPAPTQLAHKLAELAGGMPDNGRNIDHQKYAGKVYFL